MNPVIGNEREPTQMGRNRFIISDGSWVHCVHWWLMCG